MTFKPSRWKVVLLVLVGILMAGPALANPSASLKFSSIRTENPKPGKERLVLPYAFSTDSMGLTLGLGAVVKGYLQDQLLLGATAFGSLENATGGFVGMYDLRLPGSQRLYFSAMGMTSYFPRQRAYVSLDLRPGEVRSGSNDSHKDDYLEDGGRDDWMDFKLEYVLPWGSAREHSMMTYGLKNGLLQSGASGGRTWNPMESGVTVLMLRQYSRYQSFDTVQGKNDYTVHPVEVGFFYNNTDFPVNPSCGSSQYLSVTRDFGWLESEQTWTFVAFEASKYFDIGPSRLARQQVVALNFWTGDAPTWEERIDDQGYVVIKNRPPFSQGAQLGGIYRLRAYPSYRFNGRSVIYGTAEYRYTPHWNPIGDISWLQFLKMDWWQLVGFAEGGRVADSYSAGTLVRDWKLDAGLGLRAMMAGGVVRLDAGFAAEGFSLWAMFGHPF